MNLQNAEFIKSVAQPSDFIRSSLPQIVFAGKSNVGKSSVINRLLNRRNFARVGAAPGKTVHINYFLIDERAYFVDLPGYGYAKVAKAERDRWGKLMEAYFAEPQLISVGILIVDARHAPTEDDKTMANWFQATGRPMLIAANKSDKLTKTELEKNLPMIREALKLKDENRLIAFSAEKGTNRNELITEIEKSLRL